MNNLDTATQTAIENIVNNRGNGYAYTAQNIEDLKTLLGTALKTCSYKYVSERTGVSHDTIVKLVGTRKAAAVVSRVNRTVRYDVRTKALTVKRYYEEGISSLVLAKELGAHFTTVLGWTKTYKDTYSQYIEELPEGVMAIKAPKEMLVDDEIDQFRNQLQAVATQAAKHLKDYDDLREKLTTLKEEISISIKVAA